MKISVVVSTYNGESYILEQLESLYNQTRKPDEVIIYDDCSTDKTVQKIKQYIIDNNLGDSWRVEVNAQNIGWRQNFMNLLWDSTGDIVFTCDQDDIWRFDKLEISEKIMQEHQEIEVLATNYRSFFDNGKVKVGPFKNNKKLKKIPLRKNFLNVACPGCTYCIRRYTIDLSKRYWCNEFAHDDLFWRLGLFGDSLYIYSDDLINWRKHVDSAYSKESIDLKTKSEKIKWLKMTEKFDDKLIEYIQNEDLGTENKLSKLNDNKKWITIRLEFYYTSKLSCLLYLASHLSSYQRYRQFLGDIFLVYIKQK